MELNKILINVSSLSDVEKYKKLGITNFLFSLEGYSVGYKSHNFEEIKKFDVNAYIFVNRILTDDDIDEFLKLEIPKNVLGFIVEDTGLYYALKNKGYTLINYQNHLNNNYKTVNYWLNYFDSLVISTDITLDEICKIIDEASKKLVLNTFGYPMIMYSRRKLVSNFYRHLDKKAENNLEITEAISKNIFKLVENEYGTAVFDTKAIDYRDIIDKINEEKIMFYLINTEFSTYSEVERVILGHPIENIRNEFLYKKTVYRLDDVK